VAKRFGIGLIVFAALLISVSVDNLMYVLCSRCRSLSGMTIWQADVFVTCSVVNTTM